MNFSIPVDLCYYVVQKSAYKPFILYLYMKSQSDGIIYYDKGFIDKAVEQLGYRCTKSIRRNFKKLIDLGWIEYTGNKDYYFILSFDKVWFKVGIKRKQYCKYTSDDFIALKGFVAGAVITYIYKRIQWRAKMSVLIKGGRAETSKPSNAYIPFSNLYFSEIIGCSLSTAYELKQIAKKHGYIKIKKNFSALQIPLHCLKMYKETFPDIAHRIVIHKRIPMIQESDLVKPNLFMKKRKYSW